jgi:two-component system, NarL family, nitrate/nitrite response regulator NarL
MNLTEKAFIKLLLHRMVIKVAVYPFRGRKSILMSNVEILLRSQLLKDSLSLVLIEAEFSVFDERGELDNNTIVVVDFKDCKDPEFVRMHQSYGAKIVALTSQADSRELELDDIAPLSGLLTYDLSAEAFVRSLRLIGSGERVFPRDLALGRRPQGPSAPEPQSDSARLSPREKEILSHLLAGHSNKLIARELGITEATVKVHLKSVLRKIGADNRTQAAIWALANLPEINVPRSFV